MTGQLGPDAAGNPLGRDTDISEQQPVGLIGTGLFGTALAERLLADGYCVCVHNRTREKADPLLARGAAWSDNPLEECPRVIFCLYTTVQVADVLERNRASLEPGQTIVDTSTSDPLQTIALATQLASRGIAYLEAPFSGSSEQARNRQATAMVAGERTVFDACHDLWECLAAKTFYVGSWGNAARMKLVTNLVLGLNRAALAEGLAFAQAAGLAMEDALQVLVNSPAYSRIMEAKGAKMVTGDFTPQARLSQHIKDVQLMLEEAARGAVPLPLSTTHLKLLELAEQAGWGELDNSAIIRVFQNSQQPDARQD
jgi:3-hydroxyisobutyrate dehydrogenase-like beta-hydroxyacid dehydrogenase